MSLFDKPLRGIVPPLVTPLKGRDELDFAGLEKLLNHQINAGVAGIFALGTTGEGPSLSYRLRYELVEKTCEIVAGRVPVLVGITDTCVEEALELATFAKGAGANAVVAAPPYYFGLGQEENRDFLLTVADSSALPMFVYNMPSCVKLSLTAETVGQMTGHKNIVGVKDSSGDINLYKQYLELRSARPNWTFLIGPEHLMAESVIMGGDGGVNGGGNLYPKLFVSLFNAADKRNQAEIDRLQAELMKLGDIYNVAGTGPAAYLRGLKTALEAAGICSGYAAPPFIPVSDADKAKIVSLVKGLGLAQSAALNK